MSEQYYTDRQLQVKAAASKRAAEMWPQGLHLGKWDGITISAERALEIQRAAFEMGASWCADGGPDE